MWSIRTSSLTEGLRVTTAVRLDPREGRVRGVRAAVLTVPAVGGATLAHSLADGCISLLAVLAAAGLCWPAAVALLGARRRLPALLVWLLAAQVGTHLLLERMCTEVTSGQMGLLEHLRMGLNAPMVGAHVLAVGVTALALGRADTALWAADALLRAGARSLAAVRAVDRLVPPPVPRDPVPLTAEPPVLRDLWKAALPARRGPPVAH